MPVGVNFVMPGGSIFAGHRLSVEAVYALHHDYEELRDRSKLQVLCNKHIDHHL